MSYIYAIKFSCGLVKVGKTCRPKERISTHASTVRNVSGSEIINQWVSQPHTNNSENEEKLIRFCSSISDKNKSSSREWFNGCNFDAIIDYAETLNYSNDFVEREKISEETTNKYLDKMYGTADQKIEREALLLGYKCAKQLEEFIQDSLFINCNLFDVTEQYKLSPFVIIVGVYFAQNPIKMLVESISDITIDTELEAQRVFSIYDEAVSYVRSFA